MRNNRSFIRKGSMKQEVQKSDLQPDSKDGKQEEALTDNEQKSNDFSFFVSGPDRSERLTEEKNDQTKKGEETDKSISFFLPE